VKALFALALVAIAGSAYATPYAATLIKHNQRSGGGTLSSLAWKDCGPGGQSQGNGCYDLSNPWTAANIDPGASTAAWTWDDSTQVLSMTGLYIASSFVSSKAGGSPVLGDRIVDISIDTVADTATGTTNYRCIEGTFLAGVGSNGCGNYSLGLNFADESTRTYNIGGDAYCSTVTLGGDDASTGDMRGARTDVAHLSGSNSCDGTAGALNMFTVVSYSGGILVVSNGIPITDPNTAFMTFAVPVPAAVWLFGSALGLLGWVRRRTLSA
jgi:hypothetical protein